MEDYRLNQTGQEVQNILNGAVMQTELAAETERATAAEQKLQGNIDSEELARQQADAALQEYADGKVADEAAARQQADDLLQGNIDAEELARQQADDLLQGNIDAEELRAKAAEAANATDIETINGKIPAEASAENKLVDNAVLQDTYYTKAAVDNLIQGLGQNDVIVGTLPASGVANTIYRVPGDGVYSDYMWYDGAWQLLATYSANIQGYQYIGIATPTTNPGTPSNNVFYFAHEAGTYTNFGSLVVTQGINILKFDGTSWALEQLVGIDAGPTAGSVKIVQSGGVFNAIAEAGVVNISEVNKVGTTPAIYSSLSAALAAVPTSVQRGGMSIKFILRTNTGTEEEPVYKDEYVQYRLMSTAWSSDVSNWQGITSEVKAGSRDLVESGGVVKYGNYATNLFNKDDTTIVHGKRIASDGSILSTEGYMVSHYIPFDSDFLVVVIDNSDSSDSTGNMAYYDADYNLLSEYIQSSRITTRNWEEGIAYVRFTLPENAEIQISKGFIGLGADKFLSKVNVWEGKDILEYYYDAIAANLIDYVVEPKPFIKGYTSDSTLTYTNGSYKSFWLPVVKGMTLKVESTYASTNKLRFGIYSNFPNYGTSCLFQSNYSLVSGTSEQTIAISYTGIAILSFNNEPQSVHVRFDSLIEKALLPLKTEVDLISNLLQYNIPITESLPGYYTIKGQTVGSEFNHSISGPSSSYKSYAVDCVGGEQFVMNINVGGTTGRYAFTDENDIILVVDGGSSTMTDVVITAPTNAKHLYYVTKNNLISYRIKAGEYDLEKLENMASEGNVLGSFRANGELANGESLTLPTNYTRKNVSLFAEVYFDTFTSVEIGLGKNNYRGMWFIVTPTDVSAYWSESGSVLIGTYEHGLTLEDCFTLSFDRYINSGILKIYCKGEVFTQELTGLSFHGGGAGSITNNSESAINASVSVFVRDANEPVYIFGDSYLSFTDNARWPYYAIQAGYTHWFSDSLPGANSSTMIAAFKNDITLGTPKIAVWCLGMNDGADPDENTPNSNWLLYAEMFVSACEENKIIPVFGITPTIPTKLHHGKAKWIRESGYRYIDFAKAVNAQSDGTWYSGMLSSDGVHPTTLGAKALAHRAFIDLPEISVSLTI